MDDLIAFVTARLDEDEAAAEAAAGGDGIWGIAGNISPRAASAVVMARGRFETASPDEAFHIASHDPARVLREVEAKRAIVAAHPLEVFRRYGRDEICCGTCVTNHEVYMDDDHPDPWPCATVRHLAAVWSDHPDYREEWKP